MIFSRTTVGTTWCPVPTIVPARRQNRAPRANSSQVPQSRKSLNWLDLIGRCEDVREADYRLAKPPYAALWKSSIWRIQLVSGFHLGQIWSTISKSLILNA